MSKSIFIVMRRLGDKDILGSYDSIDAAIADMQKDSGIEQIGSDGLLVMQDDIGETTYTGAWSVYNADDYELTDRGYKNYREYYLIREFIV